MPDRCQKGIVLAAGIGSRLWPITRALSKQLLPVYDKPLIYYPLSVLMRAGIRDVMIITNSRDAAVFRELLGDGSWLGIVLQYAVQDQPKGIADAFLVASQFIGGDHVALALGDNVFDGPGLEEQLERAVRRESGGTVFAHHVPDPARFGIVELDEKGAPVSLQEKPTDPKSDLAVTGLYFYDNQVVEIAKALAPSSRGELEITDVNREYLRRDSLYVEVLEPGFNWLDTGTSEALLQAANLVASVESQTGRKIGCVEEIAIRMGFVSPADIESHAAQYRNDYGDYLTSLVSESGGG